MDDRSMLIWGLSLVLGTPLLVLVLGWGMEALERRKNPLARVLENIRNYFLPTLVVLLLMQQLLKLEETEMSVRVVGTAFWVAAILTTISLMNTAFSSGDKPVFWRIQLPKLFFQVLRAVVVLLIASHIISSVWQFDLTRVFTALGVGSLVIALALQDTLSNLVSGSLLVVASPFKVGDWIKFGATEARVASQNWRTVTLENVAWGYTITVPNGVLSKETITNFGTGGVWKWFSVGFSYNHPPTQVIAALNHVTDGVSTIEDGTTVVGIGSYEDSGISYDICYKVKPEYAWGASNAVKHRLYYTAKRHGLAISHPIRMLQRVDRSNKEADLLPDVAEFLRSRPYFRSLSRQTIDDLSQVAHLTHYGEGERIIQAGEFDRVLFVIQAGSVKLSVNDSHGRDCEIARLSGGELFGELVIWQDVPSLVTVTSLTDLQAITISYEFVIDLIQRYPKFALEMNRFIEERQRAVQLVQTDIRSNLSVTDSLSTNGHPILGRMMNRSDIP